METRLRVNIFMFLMSQANLGNFFLKDISDYSKIVTVRKCKMG